MNKKLTLIIFNLSVLFAQVNTESMRIDDLKIGIKNTLGAEFGFEKSDKEVRQSSLKYRIDHLAKQGFYSFLVLNYENGFENEFGKKNIISNKGFGHFRMTKKIAKKFYVEIFTQYGFNDFLLMEERKLFGSGVRYKLFKNSKINSYVGLGAMKENEKYNLKINNYKSLYRSTNYLRLNLVITKNTSLGSTAYYQFDTKRPSDYRLLYDGNFNFKMSKNFMFSFSLNYRYDNEPHGEIGKTYFKLNNGLSFNF